MRRSRRHLSLICGDRNLQFVCEDDAQMQGYALTRVFLTTFCIISAYIEIECCV